MKSSSLQQVLIPLGASLQERGGWQVASHFGSPDDEVSAARAGAVVRDASHWTRTEIRGADHLDFLHRMSTNHLLQLSRGEGLESVFPDSRGRIVEFATLCRVGEDNTLAVIPSTRSELPNWLDRYLFAEEVEMIDVTGDTAMLEVYGRQAGALAAAAVGFPLNEAAAAHSLQSPATASIKVIAAPLGGLAGFRIIGSTGEVESVAKKLIAAGARVIGENAFEVLRIEEGVPAIGSELNSDHNPWEAGLDHTIHLDKGCYIGQEVIARLDTYEKVKQRLVGLRSQSKLSAGIELQSGDRTVGVVTSAAYSPTVQLNVALAYVRTAHCAPGTEITLPDKQAVAVISPLPSVPRAS